MYFGEMLMGESDKEGQVPGAGKEAEHQAGCRGKGGGSQMGKLGGPGTTAVRRLWGRVMYILAHLM